LEAGGFETWQQFAAEIRKHRRSPEGAIVNSQGREPLETIRLPKEPRRGGSSVAPPGLSLLCVSFQGLTPLAIECRPFGAQYDIAESFSVRSADAALAGEPIGKLQFFRRSHGRECRRMGVCIDFFQAKATVSDGEVVAVVIRPRPQIVIGTSF